MSRDSVMEMEKSVDARIEELNCFSYGYLDTSADRAERPTTINKQQKESNMGTRRQVVIKAFDDDSALDVENSLVFTSGIVLTDDTDENTVREVLAMGGVLKALTDHNKVRSETVNLNILERTGQEVKLRPIKVKNLRFVVQAV